MWSSTVDDNEKKSQSHFVIFQLFFLEVLLW
jgi:hypothetical protein